ncbi:MAG: hypothetical protein J6K61_06085 [Clostridia bacterium]|nr:hypothetical protein [Clostridia bacterium]
MAGFIQENLAWLIVCFILLALSLTFLGLYLHSQIQIKRKKKAEGETKLLNIDDIDSKELPEDVLVALLTAAVAFIYSQKKTKFRVVSFRHISSKGGNP